VGCGPKDLNGAVIRSFPFPFPFASLRVRVGMRARPQASSSSSRWMSPVTSAVPSPTYMSISLRTPNSGR